MCVHCILFRPLCGPLAGFACNPFPSIIVRVSNDYTFVPTESSVLTIGGNIIQPIPPHTA
jgi:hypothetical protein